ncbi:hypothetical protein HOD20_00645 [archaeon]|jgi:hypothetical protein|nr:hypothetical protein [archaeon]MBT4647910.1 hypothetical protein [archaeon]MBT7393144.1 hypothetical protein [archaeon]
MILLSLLIVFVFYLLSILPFHLAIKFLKGKTNLLKTAFVNAIVWIVVISIERQFGFFGGAIAFLVSVILYREFFKLKWHKAFFVWLIQLVFFAFFWIIGFLLNLILGIGIVLAFFS